MNGRLQIKDGRQSFTGIISNNCKGTIYFSDKLTKKFQYDEIKYKIFWGDPQTRDEWKKGKNFYSLRFIENKNLLR